MTDKEKIAILQKALVTITNYSTSEELQNSAEEEYGLPYKEVLEMAYDNIQGVAQVALNQVIQGNNE